MGSEIDVGEILKREANGSGIEAGYERVDIFDVINKNLKVKKVEFGQDARGNNYVVIYFDNGKAVKSWSSILYKQSKAIAEWLEKNPDKLVKVRIVKPRGKNYYTFENWK